jgi:hypothetical protein
MDIVRIVKSRPRPLTVDLKHTILSPDDRIRVYGCQNYIHRVRWRVAEALL